jgi:hypothetical protein
MQFIRITPQIALLPHSNEFRHGREVGVLLIDIPFQFIYTWSTSIWGVNERTFSIFKHYIHRSIFHGQSMPVARICDSPPKVNEQLPGLTVSDHLDLPF